MQQQITLTNAAAENKRMLLVDVLRAVALFGIIINHITTGYLAGPPPAGNENYHVISGIDGVFNAGSFLLTFGKFFTIFSFLFGLSFAIQMDSAAKNGRAFASTFVWRVVILFIIGYIHNLFYSGDILVIYAVLSLLLLPLRKLSYKVIVPVALLLILNVPGLVMDIINVSTPVSPADIAAQKQFGETFAKISQEQFRIKSEGSVAEVVTMNAVDGMFGKFFFQIISGRLWITFGLFLLGMYAGRKKIFVYTDRNKRFFRGLFVWSGVVAIVSTIIAMMYANPLAKATTVQQVLGNFSYSIHQATLSAFYVSGVALLYWKVRSGSIPSLFAAAGQMGLTTYLVQSVFGVMLYYGFGLGLMGRIGAASSIGIGIAFFMLQLVFSKWWMSQFRYGPVEWLWRSITYFKWQPMSKERRVITVQPPSMIEPVSA